MTLVVPFTDKPQLNDNDKAILLLNKLKMHLYLDLINNVSRDRNLYRKINDLINYIAAADKRPVVIFENNMYKVEKDGSVYKFNVNYFTKDGEYLTEDGNVLLERKYLLPPSLITKPLPPERYLPNGYSLPGQVADLSTQPRETPPDNIFTTLTPDVLAIIFDQLPRGQMLPLSLENLRNEYISYKLPSEEIPSSLQNIVKEALQPESEYLQTFVFENVARQYVVIDANITSRRAIQVDVYMYDDKDDDHINIVSFEYPKTDDTQSVTASEIVLKYLNEHLAINKIFKVEVETSNGPTTPPVIKTYYLKPEEDMFGHVGEQFSGVDIKKPDNTNQRIDDFISEINMSPTKFRINSPIKSVITPKYGKLGTKDYIAYKVLTPDSLNKNNYVEVVHNTVTTTGFDSIKLIDADTQGGAPTCKFMGKKLRVLSKGKQTYALITLNQARAFEKKLGIKNKDATHVFGRSRKTVEHRGHTYALVPMKTLQKTKAVKS